ncbi:hypothetical protein CASFOL_035699 [Castilleja foliolosa]|uniref:Zinc finger CCCH domain-containing protein 5 n=1 Tax=Castilleja foliolosa TaxID=1961234 RepID=A0ABD3BU28_9LAMI
MPKPKVTSNDMGEEEIAEHNNTNTNTGAAEREVAGRKERRKAAKKEKRKQKRKEVAEAARREEEARLNDPEEQLRLQAEEEEEKARVERERLEFEEREKKILEEWERKIAEDQREEEDERRRRAEEDEYQLKQNHGDGADEDGWEYVEEGPPEIIWQGNEIIVKKKKIRVKKKDADQTKEDLNRPTSNPLPPQSEFVDDYKDTSILSAQQLLKNVAEETPNFGTEQDKAHCPFHLKTGACRFGSRCSRIHFYPDKSCTFLIKNMYNGPGLAWEQDEGLEHTDEEVEHAYEEFYEDVHTEFLKFGEIVNFKVCRNGSPHLRGNVYVHYKSLDSAVVAYQTVNGRYFAGKQIYEAIETSVLGRMTVQCEFVGVTRWKVAICGEFMKSKLQACSRGIACNFIHCFRNPGGDYEWADWDKAAPIYWVKKMSALFGYTDESGYERHIERGSPRLFRKSNRISTDDVDRYHYRRSRSREISYSRSSRNYSDDDDDDFRSSERRRRHTTADRKHPENFHGKQRDDTSKSRDKPYSKNGKSESQDGKSNRMSVPEIESDEKMHRVDRENYTRRHSSMSRRHSDKAASTSPDDRLFDDEERESTHIYRKENRKNHGRSYTTSDSRSRSRKDTGKTKTEFGGSEKEVHGQSKKKSRKRETGERDDSECRTERRKAKRSHVTDYRIDEATDGRGRWEPSLD